MRKVILAAINSKYIHSNLAVRYIKKYVENNSAHKIDIAEFTINNNIADIVSGLYMLKPEILGLSVYIWNKEYMFKVIRELKKVLPDCIIILGGPEVSYNPHNILMEYLEVDYIITGEGEARFLRILDGETSYDGIITREMDLAVKMKIPFLDFSDIPFPYNEEDIHGLNDKIVYYESSRGCPFSCTYCMSSIERKYRARNMEKVKRELKFFIDNKVKLVKFIDRTFNVEHTRSIEIWRFLIENYTGNTVFHFEIKPDILTYDEIQLINSAPKGYFQFEIGLQTINSDTMKEIKRINNLEKVSENIKMFNGNANLHIDLIAGLPYEDYSQFRKSFNYVYSLGGDDIQLGFLKILKGTEIEKNSKKYGYKFYDIPPYEILESNTLSYNEIIKLKEIEECVESFYNGGRFSKTLKFITSYYETPFDFFQDISTYLRGNGYFAVSHKLQAKFGYLHNFALYNGFDMEIITELLKYDYLMLGKPGSYPSWYEKQNRRQEYEKILIEAGLTNFKEIFKKSEFEIFSCNIHNYTKGEYKYLFIYDKETQVKLV